MDYMVVHHSYIQFMDLEEFLKDFQDYVQFMGELIC